MNTDERKYRRPHIKTLKDVVATVNEWAFMEYGYEVIDDLHNIPELIPLAYTDATYPNGELAEIQIYYDRVHCELVETVNDLTIQTYYINYDCFVEMMEYIRFDELVGDMIYLVESEDD